MLAQMVGRLLQGRKGLASCRAKGAAGGSQFSEATMADVMEMLQQTAMLELARRLLNDEEFLTAARAQMLELLARKIPEASKWSLEQMTKDVTRQIIETLVNERLAVVVPDLKADLARLVTAPEVKEAAERAMKDGIKLLIERKFSQW